MNESDLIPLENFFAATLAETLEDWPATQVEVAKATGIPAPHLSGMKKGDRRCTPEYDLRLGRYFGTSPGYWMRLQLAFEMEATERAKGKEIQEEVRAFEAA
jgi:addiction module HigA family antidote